MSYVYVCILYGMHTCICLQKDIYIFIPLTSRVLVNVSRMMSFVSQLFFSCSVSLSLSLSLCLSVSLSLCLCHFVSVSVCLSLSPFAHHYISFTARAPAIILERISAKAASILPSCPLQLSALAVTRPVLLTELCFGITV